MFTDDELAVGGMYTCGGSIPKQCYIIYKLEPTSLAPNIHYSRIN